MFEMRAYKNFIRLFNAISKAKTWKESSKQEKNKNERIIYWCRWSRDYAEQITEAFGLEV